MVTMTGKKRPILFTCFPNGTVLATGLKNASKFSRTACGKGGVGLGDGERDSEQCCGSALKPMRIRIEIQGLDD
jgi:hypothetical protein